MQETQARATKVDIKDGMIHISLNDGRILSIPVSRYPWLENATPEQQTNITIGSFAILWDDLDDGIDLENVMRL